ncbi:YdbH family protein [Buttiauxella warmboldiae]|uniref:YdbH family protein n=1 Tax=Buttiauxella warmboldiae TaxID=82993 RepID=A0A3N5DYT2_9ENTR|nr:YdbH family protein [Buttiauxella warmboldiae]RPH20219.1 YdbH family protein [Buttiauxella warmboldiae]
MKGRYKAIIALVLILILLPLTLLMTIAHWLPTLAGIWLPQGTSVAMEASPRLTRGAVMIPDLRYFAGECELAVIKDATLSHPKRWRLHLDSLNFNVDCLSHIPPNKSAPAAPRTLAEWQSLLPESLLTIDKVNITPWQLFSGGLRLTLSPQQQALHYKGPLLSVDARLNGQVLELKKLKVQALAGIDPVELVGTITLPPLTDKLPQQGHLATKLRIPQEAAAVDVELNWNEEQGTFAVTRPDEPEALVSLPWTISDKIFEINGGQWFWPYAGFPLRGGIALRVDDWRLGLENALISGRLNAITQGRAGKANAVLNIGPGKLSMTHSVLPVQLTGEAKQDGMVFYAVLPGEISGAIVDPQLLFRPGALLRSRGRVIDSLDVDEVRWPLAGVSVTQRGVDGRLRAIVRAHENQMGNFVLHLDGKADDFLPDAGLWRWKYWGNGEFTPLQAKWDVGGQGEWRDSIVELHSLSTGFDKLAYGSMLVSEPRLKLEKPLHWQRSQTAPSFDGSFILNAGETTFSGGSTLPPSVLTFSVTGEDPASFQYKGELHAGAIGPVRVNGRWDGARLRGNAWWPQQELAVFQPLIPGAWKMLLKEGSLYSQVAFSAAAGQGFAAGGHGVVKSGSVWLPDNQINGVDFVLPFRFGHSTWHLGTDGPVTLRIAEIKNQFTSTNLTADLEGWYPWSEAQPLMLSNVNADILGGKLHLQQLRMPQRDAALLRLENISSSELITAVNPKQFTLSGRVNGALPLWLNHPQWVVKDGWLTNPGPLTLRLDKDMADAIVKNNIAAGVAVNWLRYMEISHSWTHIDLDNLGELTLRANVQGTSQVAGKRNAVRLNYRHQENLFTLWRSLRFGDNLQTWLEQHTELPDERCQTRDKTCEETQ